MSGRYLYVQLGSKIAGSYEEQSDEEQNKAKHFMLSIRKRTQKKQCAQFKHKDFLSLLGAKNESRKQKTEQNKLTYWQTKHAGIWWKRAHVWEQYYYSILSACPSLSLCWEQPRGQTGD